MTISRVWWRFYFDSFKFPGTINTITYDIVCERRFRVNVSYLITIVGYSLRGEILFMKSILVIWSKLQKWFCQKFEHSHQFTRLWDISLLWKSFVTKTVRLRTGLWKYLPRFKNAYIILRFWSLPKSFEKPADEQSPWRAFVEQWAVRTRTGRRCGLRDLPGFLVRTYALYSYRPTRTCRNGCLELPHRFFVFFFFEAIESKPVTLWLRAKYTIHRRRVDSLSQRRRRPLLEWSMIGRDGYKTRGRVNTFTRRPIKVRPVNSILSCNVIRYRCSRRRRWRDYGTTTPRGPLGLERSRRNLRKNVVLKFTTNW